MLFRSCVFCLYMFFPLFMDTVETKALSLTHTHAHTDVRMHNAINTRIHAAHAHTHTYILMLVLPLFSCHFEESMFGHFMITTVNSVCVWGCVCVCMCVIAVSSVKAADLKRKEKRKCWFAAFFSGPWKTFHPLGKRRGHFKVKGIF